MFLMFLMTYLRESVDSCTEDSSFAMSYKLFHVLFSPLYYTIDLFRQAYHDLFAPHGTPTHTVLLKTQDSCSRRRGFVVMSSHDEAQDVINWLDGICIRYAINYYRQGYLVSVFNELFT